MKRVLPEIGFRDPARARACLARVTGAMPAELAAHVHSLLADCPDPDYVAERLDQLKDLHPDSFARILAPAGGLHSMIAVFSHSEFLTAEVLEDPDCLEAALAGERIYRQMSVHEIRAQLESRLLPGVPSPLAIAQFRRRHILRLMLRDVRGLATLPEVASEISALADAILDVTYRRIWQCLTLRHGVPRYDCRECGFSVIALGKLGGNELNYSSDIDLMFVFSGSGETDGRARITNKEFFHKAINQCTEVLSAHTAKGIGYRVDLRLRPDGRHGELCLSLDAARQYYRTRARDWELQMLIKARVAGGDPAPGRELLDFLEPLIYSSSLDFSAVEAVSEARERINEKMIRKREDGAAANQIDVKLARGGIRDIEFVVQCLQRLHGGREPWVRHGGTMLALARLRDKRLLSAPEFSKLASAYQFLRQLEHRLQLENDRQTHALPTGAAALERLARRMPPEAGGTPSASNLIAKLDAHFAEVRELYDRVIHTQRPTYTALRPATEPDARRAEGGPPEAGQEQLSGNLVRSLDQRAPELAAALARRGMKRASKLFEHFLERLIVTPRWLTKLNAAPALASQVLEIFEHSPYLANQLIRSPELIGELDRPAGGSSSARAISDPQDLRRLFVREMFRIQAESICLRAPIFQTLERSSALADSVIEAAYRIAVQQVAASKPPEAAAYVPCNQMTIVALGRLGVFEFDLGSDVDLIFILPSADASEHLFWTRAAERTIELLTAYTGDGVLLTVDPRLRPNGREGKLVQIDSAYKEYFTSHAEAWEGLTYMKARAVAGALESSTAFLNELQKLHWRRYGQTGRSRNELRRMRARLEKEQGEDNPLKAGAGGYYDLDFALMYLRLKGAGVFFKVLNTPARIDVIEGMGHLDPADAEFLREAATLHRAIDHGLTSSAANPPPISHRRPPNLPCFRTSSAAGSPASNLFRMN